MREAAGVDAGVLASAMKVSLSKLDALEHDRLEQLPDVTFARALASAICRAFGVDPAPVLALMPAPAAGLRAPVSNVNEPFHPAGESGVAALSSAFSRPLLAVIAVLLLGAALLWLWPTWPIRLTEPAPAAMPDASTDAAAPAAEPVPADRRLPLPQPPKPRRRNRCPRQPRQRRLRRRRLGAAWPRPATRR
jgi:cytoskeleton protein RodZ